MNPIARLSMDNITCRITNAKIAHLIYRNFEITAEQLVGQLVNYDARKSKGGNDTTGDKKHG